MTFSAKLTFSQNEMLASACFGPFVGKRKFAVLGQTQVCRFRPNTNLPFSAKRKFAIFGQTQVDRFRQDASLSISAKHKFWQMSCFSQKTSSVYRPVADIQSTTECHHHKVLASIECHHHQAAAPASVAVPVVVTRVKAPAVSTVSS